MTAAAWTQAELASAGPRGAAHGVRAIATTVSRRRVRAGHPLHEDLVRERVVPDGPETRLFVKPAGAGVVCDDEKTNRAERWDASQAPQDGREDEPAQSSPLVVAANGQGPHPPASPDPCVGMQDDEPGRFVLDLDEEQGVGRALPHPGKDLGQRVEELGDLDRIEPDGLDLTEVGSGKPAEAKPRPVPLSGWHGEPSR